MVKNINLGIIFWKDFKNNIAKYFDLDYIIIIEKRKFI